MAASLALALPVLLAAQQFRPAPLHVEFLVRQAAPATGAHRLAR